MLRCVPAVSPYPAIPPAEDVDEFGFIARLLAPLAADSGAYALTDDAATLSIDATHELVLTKDLMVEGVHFLATEDPGVMARRLLRVNLSDLAAMGAAPRGCLLGLALPPDRREEGFLSTFTEGLRTDLARYGIALLGGDTTASPHLVLSLTALGTVPRGGAVRRRGARPGDLVCVTGTIGDAAFGLAVALGKLPGLDPLDRAYLLERYRLPRPRLAFGVLARDRLRAAADISDGLVADCANVAAASGVAAVLRAESVPLSGPAYGLVGQEGFWNTVLAGGDDHELVFAVDPEDLVAVGRVAEATGAAVTVVGRFEAGSGVTVRDGQGEIIPTRGGFTHF